MIFSLKKYIFIVFFIASFFVVVDFTLAGDANTLLWGNQAGNIQANTGLGTTDPRIIISQIINIILGFLGIVAVVIILYGGWLWMTSQGDANQIEKAKKILISAIIGLVIIMSAFGIAQFVLNRLYDATAGCTPGDFKNCGCGGMGTQTCNAGGTWDACFGGDCIVGESCCFGGFCAADCAAPPSFVITNTSPADGSINLPRNAKIRFRTNLPINAGTVGLGVGGTFHVVDGGGVDIPGNITPITGRIIEYTPSGACPANICGATECLPGGEIITVTADNGILSVGGNNLTCNILNPCVITFTTSNVVDCDNPNISLDFDQICSIPNNEIYANSSDDSGVWQIEYFVNNVPIVNNPPISGPNPIINPFPAPGAFNTRALFMPSVFDGTVFVPGDTLSLRATVYDVDAHSSSDTKNTILRPAHCCSGILDGDEEGVDCGGSCARCNGAACGASLNDACVAGDCSANNNLCASQFCNCTTPAAPGCQTAGYAAGINDCCLCQQAPIIDWITPIGGFCDGVGGENISCTEDNETINCAAFGGICNTDIANGASGNLITIGGRWFGSAPGIVQIGGVNADNGQIGDVIQYNGVRLNNNSAFFGNINTNVPATANIFAANLLGQANVPNITNGHTTTFTVSPGPDVVSSNYLRFRKTAEPEAGPRIISFEPVQGNEGQYVTIFGEGFGGSRGTSNVRFDLVDADFNFPDVCSDNLWSDTQIIVKVPALANGPYTIFIDLDSGPTIDTTLLSPNVFTFNNALPLLPSLCKIEPKIGPNNSSVSLFGEYFDAYNANSKARFHLNRDQTGPAIPAPIGPIQKWQLNGDHYEVEVLVHQLAVSGPVRIVKDFPEQVGNGLNFRVGSCNKETNPNEACGAGNVCCPTGSYNEGQCVVNSDDCNLGFETSVYEWDFSTNITGGQIGDPCDDDLVMPACQASSTMCALPLECNTTTCTCQPAPGESCSGVGLSECNLVTFCPNSPGQCSTYPGGQPEQIGSCIFSCEGVGGCTAAICDYNNVLDRCVLTGLSCDMTQPAVDALLNPITSYCADYGGVGRWHINTPMSCPLGWTQIFGGRCVNLAANCDICNAGFVCSGGLCAVDRDICPASSICNNTDECVASDVAACECCCEIGQDARDCCSPLTCEGTCGDDLVDDGAGFGECSGCANAGVTQADHDNACNCSGHIGKFCETTDPAFPNGVCRDCTRLSNEPECDLHNTCCTDAMQGGACRGGDGAVAGLLGDCAYYNCVQPNNDVCNVNPVNSGDFRDLGTCNTKCVPGPAGLGLSCASTSTDPFISNVCNTIICNPPFECLNASGAGATPPDDCGFCCCDPTVGNVCGPLLTCDPDNAPCSGAGRGLCCGCDADIDCNNVAMMGCGRDACCRQRPSVVPNSEVPADEPPGLPGMGRICRNALISATFDQLMDTASFSGNMIVIGDYGGNTCPAGTEYLITKKEEKYNNIFEFIVLKIKKLASFLPGKFANAYTIPNALNHYCAVAGTVSSEVNGLGNSVIKFAPKNALDADRLYYVIIKGDESLDSSKGVLNNWGIGMNGPFNANNVFNSIVYNNAHIWSFRTLPETATNDGICLLGEVELNPYSYLFKTTKNNPQENVYQVK